MQIKTRIENWIGRITVGNNWMLTSALLLTVVSLFFSFPSYSDINSEEWKPLFEKADNLFGNSSYGDGTHAAKLTFRMVLPAIVHFAHLNMTGVLVLLGIVGMLNFYLVLRLAYNILNDKREAFMVGLCSALIYFGKCSFTELRGTMFDGLAIFFLLCAMNTRRNVLLALFVLLAAWCDERALVASALIWVYYIVKNDKKRIGLQLFAPQALWIYTAWFLYIAKRYYLSTYMGMHTDTKGVGLSVLLDQINNIPLGVWSALEGLWLVVIYAMLMLYRHKQFFALFAYAVVCGIILLLGLSVVDITRSVVYIFPAVFIGLKIVKDHYDKDAMMKLLWMALILCFVYPAYYTGGKSSVWWTYPLPLQLLR